MEFEETTFSFSKQPPAQPDRRNASRHLTILRVGTLVLDDRRELCLVRNISAGGLLAHVYSVLAAGQRVRVELKTNQLLPGHVSWADEANVGIAFDAPIDVEAMLASGPALENGWRQRLPRVEVDRLATLRVGGRTHWVSTRDISQGGIKIELDQPLEPGANVILELDKLQPVAGAVRWSGGGLCGISFNQVIPFHELMRWLREP